MNYSFYPDAEEELLASIEYYEQIETGLGYDFALEIYSAIKLAVDFPYAWPSIDKEIRRVLVRRFPYGVLYSIEDKNLIVLAVMSLNREPYYWKNRKNNSNSE